MSDSENQRRLNDTDSRFVVDWEVGLGSVEGGDEPCVLVSLGSLALGTEYGQALFNQGPADETLHFVMSPERAGRLAEALLLAAGS
jgi:hypothetical protein